MNILITICARGGSKGIPGKNIRPLAGKELINYSVEMAEKIAKSLNADIALSTEDEAIKNVVRAAAVNKSYLRPAEMATDTAGKIVAIDHVMRYMEAQLDKQYDYVLDLDVTSPLRTEDDILTAFDQIRADNQALTLFSVNNANRNPYFNMVEDAGNGYVRIAKKLERDAVFLSRQTAPKVFDINGSFYWYKRPFFETGLLTPITDRTLVYVMKHICFDLDHLIDFDFMEYLIKEGKLDFAL